MADDNNTGTTPPATGGDGAGSTTGGDALGDAGKRALTAERQRATAAERKAADLEAEIEKLRNKDKPDIERLTSERDAAAKKAADLEANLLRLEVAAEKGLTPAQAKRLAGSTREELAADADELLTDFGGAKKGAGDGKDGGKDGEQGGATPAGRPSEHMSGGSNPGAEPEETDVRKLGARMFAR